MIKWILNISIWVLAFFTCSSAAGQELAMVSEENLYILEEGEEEKESVRSTTSDTNSIELNFNSFNFNLIPCADLYDEVWDSLNVDVPEFSKNDVANCVVLPLTEDDCGYVHPFHGKVTSDFGWRRYRMHKGIDIDLNTGDSIFAAFDGVVRISKYNYGGFGNYVVIRHYNGVETLYGHLSRRLVEPNTVVRAGEVIGLGGNTGRSTGSHLHFEVRFRGQAINPNRIVDFDNGMLVTDTLNLDMEDFGYLFNRGWTYTPVKTETTADGKIYHTMRSGDTLWALSKKYNTTVAQICKLNGITTRTTLRIGRVIRIQ